MNILEKPFLLLGMAGIFLSSTLFANDQQNEDIIVIGNKEKADVYQQLISSQFIVRGGGKHEGQYARFAGPVCPSVTGFSDQVNQRLKERIREVIALAKVRLAKKKCKENMIVIAVNDGAEAIKDLRKNQSRLFSSLPIPDRDRLEQSSDPVYNWKTVQKLSSDSKGNAKAGTVSIIAAQGSGVAPGAASTGAQSYGGQRSHVKSKLRRSTVEGIIYSYLLVERSALNDVTVIQLADYATMLSLIDMDSEKETTPPPAYSILSLFDQKDPALRPEAIGDVDLALLSALYKTPGNVRASAQRSAMVHRINKQLDKEGEKTKREDRQRQ